METDSEVARVLVVDDEQHLLKTMSLALQALGYHVHALINPQEALDAAEPGRFQLAFVDLKMRPIDGMEVLRTLRQRSPDTTVILVTAHGTVQSAVEAMKEGAYYYLQKPFELKELQLLAEKALEHHQLAREVQSLRAQLSGHGTYGSIVTQDSVMRELLDLAAHVADSTISVVIEGESGTGKEGVAQLIHERSPRREKPFVRVNCAALPESLLESELFGHARGSFTGAVKDRQGRFELANSGTIFLDEIGEMPIALQVKLLRVLQHKEYERLGESTTRRADVRVVAATNRDLDSAIQEKTFREDLFYRLAGVRLRLPPLRERPSDIPLLVQHFAGVFARGESVEIGPEAMRALRVYRWPGNVRELQNVVERFVLLARGSRIDLIHLPPEVRAAQEQPFQELSLEEVEKRHIRHILQRAEDYEDAARILGIDPATLWRKRKRYGF